MPIFRNIIQYLCSFKEFSDGCFIEQRHTKDSKYIKGAAIKAKIMFDNCHKAICRYRRIYLDSNCIFCDAPEGFYVQMLPDPFKSLM